MIEVKKMKKIIIISLILVLHFQSVYGQVFSDYLPGGKNYLDPENMTINSNELSLISPIKVKSNTEYTISFPGYEMIGDNPYLMIIGDISYIDDLTNNVSGCYEDQDEVVCTFTTSTTE